MVLTKTGSLEDHPLQLREVVNPWPRAGEIRIQVAACGVCHTELDEIEGRLESRLPVIPGHQVIGRVDALGPRTTCFTVGQRVGVAWLYSSCGVCDFCLADQENLCEQFRGTGCHADGGYAEHMGAPEQSVYPIPESFSDVQAAPLLCAGVVGYRALRLTNLQDGQSLGFFGFGASAHIVLQAARHKFPKARLLVFTRAGQTEHQKLATNLGADWVGTTGETPPVPLDAAIDTTPAWTPIVEALRILRPGGRLVINAIRKESKDQDAWLRLDYATHLWREKEIKTVANVTRRDALEFLPLAAQAGIRPEVQEFALEQATEALSLVKRGATKGAAVLRIA